MYVNPTKNTLWEDMVEASTFNELQQRMVDVILTDLLDAKQRLDLWAGFSLTFMTTS